MLLVLAVLVNVIVPVQSELTVYVPVNWRKLSRLPVVEVEAVELPEGETTFPAPSN